MANFDALLEKFNEKMKKHRVRLHGAVLMSGKEVVGEIYNRPYTAETKTRMYSVSKSVVAVAIGRLVGEGKLSLDERIVDILPTDSICQAFTLGSKSRPCAIC